MGTVVRAAVVDQAGADIDVSSATDLIFRFQKPDGSRVDVAAAAGTDPNSLEATTAPGLFDQTGDWKVQGRVTLSPTSLFWTEVKGFQVGDQLNAPA